MLMVQVVALISMLLLESIAATFMRILLQAVPLLVLHALLLVFLLAAT